MLKTVRDERELVRSVATEEASMWRYGQGRGEISDWEAGGPTMLHRGLKELDILAGAVLEHVCPPPMEVANRGRLESLLDALSDEIVDQPDGPAMDVNESSVRQHGDSCFGSLVRPRLASRELSQGHRPGDDNEGRQRHRRPGIESSDPPTVESLEQGIIRIRRTGEASYPVREPICAGPDLFRAIVIHPRHQSMGERDPIVSREWAEHE
jgi:hypothetical protein